MSGPRQAPPPRAGSGPREPAAARRIDGRGGPQRATAAPAAGAPAGRTARRRAPAASRPPAPLDPPGTLSAWQQLLAELDRLLRDPTLTRALQRFAAKVASGLRGLPEAIVAAARSMARALARLRLPRRVLLGLLALLLPLALLALLSGAGDEPATRGAPTPAVAPAGGAPGGLTLPAVGMPQVLAAPDDVRPVRVALVLDRTYDTPALRRELRALGGWLTENHAPGTRIAVIDAPSARASVPLDAARLGGASPARQRTSTAAAIRSALARRNGRGLVVTLGTAASAATAASASGAAKTLQIATRPGPATGSSTVLERRRRARVTIDERRPNALAASVARAIMAISGERERR